jgi:phosphoglycolate phosphatase
MIRCIVFDFDGTLVDSNRIKWRSNFEVVKAIPNGRDIMERILTAPDRGDRYATFKQFAKMAELPSGSSENLARQYSDLCRSLIAACPNMPGANEALEVLRTRQCGLFINSATPEVELRSIVQTRDFSRVLDGVFGRPAAKTDNLRHILTLLNISPGELVVVGDGADDHAAAAQTGCQFVPVFAFPEEIACPELTLRDLSHLPAAIEKISRQCDEQTQSPAPDKSEA